MDLEHSQSVEISWREPYRQYRGLLFGIGYRMTGSVADAEDLVQDVFLQLRDVPPGTIRHMKAYLCRSVTNRALDLMKSSRRRREDYVGPWLPEPLTGSWEADPWEEVARKETVAFAVLTLLEKLNPVERAVFVLREAFGFEYADIAAILGKSEANCRKLLSRVKPKLAPMLQEPEAASTDVLEAGSQAAALTEAFLDASSTGRMDGFVRLLAEEAVLYSDGGGKVRAAIRPIFGSSRILAFLAGLQRKAEESGQTITLRPVRFNAQIGLELRTGPFLTGLLAFGFRDGHITELFLQRNPDKMASYPDSPEASPFHTGGRQA
ncbi:RNA polymerase sigma factor SigJ [Gorillibacterium sp. sgz5001074]|uniref:RNA polymerase sigma factor SigJ n=1 Tax=Gorillibacterium sp. sgz5001074 TaxID=3446695 RepID=UPI003F678092